MSEYEQSSATPLVEQRRDEIMAALTANEKLTQEQLARRFGVSRTTIVGDMQARGINRLPRRKREGEIAPGSVSQSTINEVFLYRRGTAETHIRHWLPQNPIFKQLNELLPPRDQISESNEPELTKSTMTTLRTKRQSMLRSWPIQTGTGWRPKKALTPTFAGFLPEKLQTGTGEIKKKL